MADVERFEGKVISILNARAAFCRPYSPQQRKNKDGSARGKPKYSTTALLDPSNAAHAATIKEIKEEALRCLLHRYKSQDKFPKANPATGIGGLIMCFGYGDDLPKVYDGYAGMFYIKLTDTDAPLVGNRNGRPVAEGQPEAPYGGAICNFKTTLYSYDNESRGVNANFRSIQFVAPGAAFGGRGQLDPSQEFTPLGESSMPVATGTERDPWDA